MKLTEVITLLATVLVAGWFSAFIVQFIKQAKWASWVKLVISAVIAIVVAIATLWLSGDVTSFLDTYSNGTLDVEHIIAFATLIFTSAATWYRFYFKDATWAQNLGNWPGGSSE